MSFPFGKATDFATLGMAAQVHAFDEAVKAYATARALSAELGAEMAAVPHPAPEQLRQRLVDASQELFVAGETVKAYAMVLSGNRVFGHCEDLLKDEALLAGGMAGPY